MGIPEGGRRRVKGLVYGAYERSLSAHLDHEKAPAHVGLIFDGNRRWAAQRGGDSAHGHKAGAQKIPEFLGWCEEAGVEVVTIWLLSTDNFKRSEAELNALLGIIEDVVSELAEAGRWRINPVGAHDILPESMRQALEAGKRATESVEGLIVNVAVGYGGRQEITDAVRSLLRERAAAGESIDEIAENLSVDQISEHLYTKGQPDPDLVIRTSGEQRLSGFLLWQSAHSEFYFCEAFWPDFRKVDFLRALRVYTERERRFGS